MRPIFIGSGVALVTPFDKDGEIDYGRFKSNIEFQIQSGTDAIIVCGTTGEGSTLSVEERLGLFRVAAEQVDKRVPIIGGTGSNSTFFTIDLAKRAEECGIDAHLIVTPYYNKTSQNGLVSHYFKIADSVTKPVIVYNVPSRTGMNVLPETYQKLAEHDNIVAVKEADTNISKVLKSMALCGDKLSFYSGNDDLVSTFMSAGGSGVISVAANIMPRYMHDLAIAGYKGDHVACDKQQKHILELIEALFIDVNPIPVKEAMKILGADTGRLRGPLFNMTEDKLEKLRAVIEKYKPDIEI